MCLVRVFVRADVMTRFIGRAISPPTAGPGQGTWIETRWHNWGPLPGVTRPPFMTPGSLKEVPKGTMAPDPRLYEPGGVLDTAAVMVPGDAGGRKESGKSIAFDNFSKWQARLLYTTVDRSSRTP